MECFLHPKLMVRSPETPLPRDTNEEILELGADEQPRLKEKEVPSNQMEDPIHALFNPPKRSRDGEGLYLHLICVHTSYSFGDEVMQALSCPFIHLSVFHLSICLPVYLLCRSLRCPAPSCSGQPHCSDLQSATQNNSLVVLPLWSV